MSVEYACFRYYDDHYYILVVYVVQSSCRPNSNLILSILGSYLSFQPLENLMISQSGCITVYLDIFIVTKSRFNSRITPE